MNTYLITRPAAWANAAELEATAKISARIGDEQMRDRVRWIRSYVTQHENGRIGTVCIYQATDPEALREHARCVGMPAETITPVMETVVINDDPAAERK
jgi:alkanesulfonate monooxygenase SsuD/methylene tetrahydromethanopterin reductase-like flavin-dependent oxidoreductase (luciferase family)